MKWNTFFGFEDRGLPLCTIWLVMITKEFQTFCESTCVLCDAAQHDCYYLHNMLARMCDDECDGKRHRTRKHDSLNFWLFSSSSIGASLSLCAHIIVIALLLLHDYFYFFRYVAHSNYSLSHWCNNINCLLNENCASTTFGECHRNIEQ